MIWIGFKRMGFVRTTFLRFIVWFSYTQCFFISRYSIFKIGEMVLTIEKSNLMGFLQMASVAYLLFVVKSFFCPVSIVLLLLFSVYCLPSGFFRQYLFYLAQWFLFQRYSIRMYWLLRNQICWDFCRWQAWLFYSLLLSSYWQYCLLSVFSCVHASLHISLSVSLSVHQSVSKILKYWMFLGCFIC